MEYKFREIEKKWQKYWEKNKTFKAFDDFQNPKKYYILDMFPYPSGSGLHVGHPEGYTASDIMARYKRMKGYNVLHPMGWDAFGLPAEQFAMDTGTHPAIITNKNCDTFRRQIKDIGLSYDWDREINTTDPGYFKWTQWIFIQLYNTWYDEKLQKGRHINELEVPADIKSRGDDYVRSYIDGKRLAYYDKALVWWCSSCKIVCANEEVLTDGSHEKCGHPVEKMNLKQWMLRIPLYAERLLSGLDDLDWPEGIKDQQRNWIGKSTGAEVKFHVENTGDIISVFTTRPDTLFGATYMVLAPEHELTARLTTGEKEKEVRKYIKDAVLKSDLDRTDLAKEKTGVFTGSYAINPVNNKKIPVWIADYVLTGYGTGAIMAVPAHDERDFEFALKYELPVECIMNPDTDDQELKEKTLEGKACWTEDGTYVNSSDKKTGLDINGLKKEEGIKKTIEWLESRQLGKATVNYKLRDWLFSRQRYWGEPFPVIHWEDGTISLLDEAELPLELPVLEKYQPGENGESPLANATDWLMVTGKNGMKGRRETNTMPQWAGSCWYYLRFIDPHNSKAIFSKEKEKYWMPVDLYIGGAEHAVLHLLYSRFWHKVLYDLAYTSHDEPYLKLFNQGMILAFAYETKTGAKVPADLVEEKEGRYFHRNTGEELTQIVAKMSKSLKNVVNPDDIIQRYGADAFRLYEMFMGPLDASKPWDEKGVKGVFGFLTRVARLFGDLSCVSDETESDEILQALHKTIRKVENDIENLRFNTAISSLMIFTNLAVKKGKVNRDTAKTFVRILHPFAPHLAEELWEAYGNKESLANEEWPEVNEKYLKEDTFEYPVSFNGKLRFRLELPLDMENNEIENAVLGDERASRWLEGNKPRRIIIVKGRIINVVI
ncbi:MAG TPA: leucine--tRNA ligase [Bacteroidetes bacterium]|nr:leucine--tRNA ligase [Bacteroidota bacterium]